ncbi:MULTISPECIES: ATP-binding protein [unclassified Iodobacter]|uniref:ATP-binding protein n=1 Tax=unclassified Iodobacter TaxID=235634 RepID=UPI0025D93D3A|nr:MULTISPECIES: ATP-binding protein [unclassified Iodobacter]MDW5415530.1 ATP-binding protein [Iodobacter sp. CM08]
MRFRFLPPSLLGRLSLVMVLGVLTTMLIGNWLWANQLKTKTAREVSVAAQHIGSAAASAVRFFQSLPPNYRPILIEQLRDMGGTRFFVGVNRAPVAIQEIPESLLSKTVLEKVRQTLSDDLPRLSDTRIGFAMPDGLVVSDEGITVADLPEEWVQHTLLIKPRPAPILVIQAEIEPGGWLYLATLMPDPYFLDNGNPLPLDRLLLQGLTLATVLLMSILVVRWITLPLAALSDAAVAFGKGESPPLPESGSREFIRTARAFTAMRERIARYLEDRERLFASISHDLRTPITRLKLRAELLDDEELSQAFHEDLDELDMMVKGALQSVKDTDIHENHTELALDQLLGRMVRDASLAGHYVEYQACGLKVMGKPLALRRALVNLLDNALFYGKVARIAARQVEGGVCISIHDDGPGVPAEALATLFQPYVRLEHGRSSNQQGMGLGLGIAQNIVQAHGGVLELFNHPDGGLLVSVTLPA